MKKLLLLFVLLIFVNGCKDDDEPEQEEESTEIELTTINYSIELPDDVETSAIADYKLSNAYGDYDLQVSAGRGTNTTNNVSSTVQVLDNGSYQINY